MPCTLAVFRQIMQTGQYWKCLQFCNLCILLLRVVFAYFHVKIEKMSLNVFPYPWDTLYNKCVVTLSSGLLFVIVWLLHCSKKKWVAITMSLGALNDYLEEMVGGPIKYLFLSTFRVRNVHVDVGGGWKRAKLCPHTVKSRAVDCLS